MMRSFCLEKSLEVSNRRNLDSGQISAHEDGKGKVYQDMTLPINSYFISSGHNSYLTGNQLNSSSGIQTIVQALKKGCRVIELDVYNAPASTEEPICKHGGTLTDPVSFRACVEAIHENAFLSSEYPVIITIENHADYWNQQTMAEVLRLELGPLLFIPSVLTSTDVSHGTTGKYLSPYALREKIIIRCNLSPESHPDFIEIVYIRNKKFQGFAASIGVGASTSSSFAESILPSVAEFQGPSFGPAKTGKEKGNGKRGSGEGVVENGPEKRDATVRTISDPSKSATDVATVEEAAMIASSSSTHITPNNITTATITSTIPPPLASGSLQEVLSYSSKHLMRVYPSGIRIDSSNYNPFMAWRLGASLAALNWQSWDKPCWINEGMFKDNGQCGYVLKPAWMRDPSVGLPSRPPRVLMPYILGVSLGGGASPGTGSPSGFDTSGLSVQVAVHGMPMDDQKKKFMLRQTGEEGGKRSRRGQGRRVEGGRGEGGRGEGGRGDEGKLEQDNEEDKGDVERANSNNFDIELANTSNDDDNSKSIFDTDDMGKSSYRLAQCKTINLNVVVSSSNLLSTTTTSPSSTALPIHLMTISPPELHKYDSDKPGFSSAMTPLQVASENYAKFPLYYPEVCVLVFQVKSQKKFSGGRNSVIGYASLPVNSLPLGRIRIPIQKPTGYGLPLDSDHAWMDVNFEWEDKLPSPYRLGFL